LTRGFDRYYGTAGGGNYFAPKPLFLDREQVKPENDYYFTDAVTSYAVQFLEEHGRNHRGKPFFMNLCYTAPHFPLQARPEDIEKYRGRYGDGWDSLRERRFARQKALGILDPRWKLSKRDPVAQAWADTAGKEEWDLRMAVYAAMIGRMDQGIGRVLEAVKRIGASQNTLVLFLSDNGASAEALDSWPEPARGHKPGSTVGTRESHRCLEVGWANAANTPCREHKMWVHEGGIATPLIAFWPAGIKAEGKLTAEVGHVVDLMPTLIELAGVEYPRSFQGRELTPLEGKSLVPVFEGKPLGGRTLAWEHEGNRAIRVGNWKLVASFQGDWELYDLAADRTELNNLASQSPERVKQLSRLWQDWADRAGVVPWEELPASSYKPTNGYSKKSEPAAP
jgi:arylsulfatase